jgi:hypothetical protein
MFLFAVIDYKRNPSLDACYVIYHRYVKEVKEQKGAVNDQDRKHVFWVNLAAPVRTMIETRLATRQLDPNIYDDAFKEILLMLNKQDGAQRTSMNKFSEKYGLEIMAKNTFTLFPFQ